MSETGTVREARVVKSFDQRFEAAALNTAQKWTFSPGTLNGQPIAVRVVLQFEFRLN